jgi:uncharacterized protein YkwD
VAHSIARPIRGGFTVATAIVLTAGIAVGWSTAGHGASLESWQRPPSETEYGLLTLANMARSDPAAADSPQYSPVRPLAWNDDLGDAARYHSWDEITNHCFQHDSCNGENCAHRVGRYYKGWYDLGENIGGGGGGALLDHGGWMSSSGHRANILSSNHQEFGAGSLVDPVSTFDDATEDFGARGLVQIPPIPAGTVLVPTFWEGTENGSVWHYQLLVNSFDDHGCTPVDVNAYVDGVAQPLTRVAGTNTNGTWGGYATGPGYRQNPFGLPDPYCKRVYFQITRSDGQTFRYPTSDDIGLGFADGCDIRAPHGGPPPPPHEPPPAGSGPVVTIDAPSSGAHVSGTVEIHAHASDDGVVKHIEVYVDGKRIVRKGSGSVTRRWNAGARAWSPGPHTITVKAFDDEQHEGDASMVVIK